MNIKTLQQNAEYEKFDADSRLCYFKPRNAKTRYNFASELAHSLTQNPKFISPKFFYNKTGSELFDKICTLPEYYLTRTEIQILKKLSSELVLYLDDEFRLVELGSGTATKTRLLLDILHSQQHKTEYFPIDISEILKDSSKDLLKSYSKLHIIGIIDTYENGLAFLNEYDDKNHLIVFLGSSFGNFCLKEGIDFLKKINSAMKDNDLFLLGLDLVKEKSILKKAYDDSQGVTSKFNLNVLSRINDELGGNFELENFEHVVKYDQAEKRIEMYIRSLCNQSVSIPKAQIAIELKKDELIHTEDSHKFSMDDIKTMMKKSSFSIKQIWLDDNRYYAMVLASKD